MPIYVLFILLATLESVAVVDLIPDVGEFETLRAHIQSRTRHAILSMGSVRRTPIAEFNNSELLLSMAFPTLYPSVAGEFVRPRLREVDLLAYARHIICYKDGRFARHPRFRFAVFNSLLRRQMAARAGFYVKARGGTGDISVGEIREQFDGPDGGRSLINSIIQFTSNVKGSRAFWTTEGKKLESMVSLSIGITITPTNTPTKTPTNIKSGQTTQITITVYYILGGRLSLA